jgi:hypothetical protein
MSYSGNAVVFFYKGNMRGMIRIIPVKERDSTIFKHIDMFKATQGQPIYCMYIGDFTKILDTCKKKKAIHSNICKYGHTSYCARIWISYKNYLAGPDRSGLPDSCQCIDLSRILKIGELREFKVLQ